MADEETMLRSINFNRIGTDKGKPQEDRLYTPIEGESGATISDIKAALGNRFDIVLLHDPTDGCLVLNLMPGAEKDITILPCQLHKEE